VSASSINRAANDPQLQARVLAIAQKEMVYNAELAATQFGTGIIMPLMWPIAADQEEQYETALMAGRGAPGHDTDIITDQALLSGVISFWPPDPEVVTP
jgi:hypothetical protein